jgi:transcriptional regulator with XRE-family HTH domain
VPDTRIGSKLATLRESLRLTVDELAQRCECEPSVIAALEAGELSPSLAPLLRITRALGVRLGTLLDDDDAVGPVVTRAGTAETATRLKSLQTSSDAGVLSYHSLAANKPSRHMEPFIIDVAPGVEERSGRSSHEGEEFLYVLSGSLEIEYGRDVHVLWPGDSIYFESIVPHVVRTHGAVPARLLAVVHVPE